MTADAKTLNNEVVDGPPPVEGIWDNFGQPLINLNSYVSCDDPTPLALAVLDAYEIPYNLSSHSFRYGTLKDMDIKRMDAMTVLRNSLMEESFAGPEDRFIEAIVSAKGKVEFREIGKEISNLDDVYYSIQTGQYVDRPKGVMVTGGKPTPDFKPLHWSPIWANEDGGADIYAAGSMLNNCMEEKWKSYATIVFTDPHLESKYEDGIDNLYEIGKDNPWDEILGYVVCIDPGPDATTNTSIQYNTEAEIPLKIASAEDGICPIGNLQNMPIYDPLQKDKNCWGSMVDEEVNYEDGVPVVIPDRFRFKSVRGSKVDNFVSISNVYVIGQEIDALYARPVDDLSSLADITEDNSTIWVTQNNIRRTSYKLDEKRHYAVAYEDLDSDGYQEISIVFSQEVRPHDKITYGNGIEGAGMEFKMDPLCEQAKAAEFTDGTAGRKTILPWNKTKGIFVEEIWVTVKVETPSITIHDPDGRNQKALRIAENLKYYISPMVATSPPAPVGYAGNGSVDGPIDQIPSLRDNDPTTTQDFSNTPMEIAMDEMQGSGMAITFGFLNGYGDNAIDAYDEGEKEAQQAAETIFNMINDDVTETVYTCGPKANPRLGDQGPALGIINSIKYSYSDQGSYTISVTEGPAVVGNLVQVDGGPSQKMSEDNSARGTVTQALGDNIHFKVRIDGFGDRWAVNTSHDIIREKDVVQCTIHNNPVEA